ncbi:alpha/beta hydrolase [Bradyrhizobium sp. RDM12]
MATAASGVIGAARAQSARKTIVFVSGAFCGGWIWRRVTDRLEQGGHNVFAQSLTGLADRSHLLSKDVNLDTHIADVVNLIKWESLENVCLVAWSYAGFVGSGALENIGDRVSSVVWLDAFIPTDGQRVADFAAEPVRKGIQAAIDKGDPGVRGSAHYPPVLLPNAIGRSPSPRLLHIRSALIFSRSSFPGRSKRWRRRHTSAFRNFHSRPSTRHWLTARATSRGPRSNCRTLGTWPCSMHQTA